MGQLYSCILTICQVVCVPEATHVKLQKESVKKSKERGHFTVLQADLHVRERSLTGLVVGLRSTSSEMSNMNFLAPAKTWDIQTLLRGPSLPLVLGWTIHWGMTSCALFHKHAIHSCLPSVSFSSVALRAEKWLCHLWKPSGAQGLIAATSGHHACTVTDADCELHSTKDELNSWRLNLF